MPGIAAGLICRGLVAAYHEFSAVRGIITTCRHRGPILTMGVQSYW